MSSLSRQRVSWLQENAIDQFYLYSAIMGQLPTAYRVLQLHTCTWITFPPSCWQDHLTHSNQLQCVLQCHTIQYTFINLNAESTRTHRQTGCCNCQRTQHVSKNAMKLSLLSTPKFLAYSPISSYWELGEGSFLSTESYLAEILHISTCMWHPHQGKDVCK